MFRVDKKKHFFFLIAYHFEYKSVARFYRKLFSKLKLDESDDKIWKRIELDLRLGREPKMPSIQPIQNVHDAKFN